jgi:alkanesulfonate monooxygenase SsuD/methylene tetrahydromethanopterin reductase-like flavin-dependent oxidoreductase (luciferase family)
MGLGKPLKLLADVPDRPIPIYLGVTGPRTVEQAGAIADGWIPFLYVPEHAGELMAPLLRGIERAGRRRVDVDVSPVVPAAVADDVAQAREQVKPFLAFYLGAMGSRDANFYVDVVERLGYGTAARACQQQFAAGGRRGAAAALPDGLVDLFAIAATPRTLEASVQRMADSGADTLLVVPFGDRPRLLQVLASHLS